MEAIKKITNSMQIYADSVAVLPDGNATLVTLGGINISNVLAEFSASEVLECIDLDEIVRYISDKQAEDGNENNR